jgi:ribosomal protein L40E
MGSIALTRQAFDPVRAHQRRCGKCGKLVSRAAYQCRRCGKTQRIRPRTILLGLSAGLIVGMFAVASASALSLRPHPVEAAVAPSAVPAHAPISAGRAPEISATDLWSAYTSDAAGADRAYRDHPLTVSGVVRSIDRNYGGQMVVRLGTGDAFETVNATLATRDDPALSGLAKGRTASLLCVGRGALMGAPVLANCFLR